MARAFIIWTFALFLAAGISAIAISAGQSEIHAATGSFNVSGPMPTASPTPTPTAHPTSTSVPPPPPTPEPSPTDMPTPTAEPSPTASPTATPAPTPTATSSGSSQPSTSLKLIIDIMGERTTGLRTITGKVLGDVTAVSEDGKIAVTIYKDTFVFNTFGEPLAVINITAVDPRLKAPPLSLPADHYFVYIYEFSPHGAAFSAPIDIEFTYNQSDLPKSPDELTFQVYRMNGAPDEWEALASTSDTGTSSVLCPANHLSTYALIATPLNETEPTPQPTPAPVTPSSHGNWIYLVLTLPTALFLLFIYIMIRWRLKNEQSTEIESDQ